MPLTMNREVFITCAVTGSAPSGAGIAAVGGFATGVVPPTVANGSTPSLLKLYGDINGDGSMVYVEYTCDTGTGRLSRWEDVLRRIAADGDASITDR